MADDDESMDGGQVVTLAKKPSFIQAILNKMAEPDTAPVTPFADTMPDLNVPAAPPPRPVPPVDMQPIQDLTQAPPGAPKLAPETKAHKLLKILLGGLSGGAAGAGQMTFGGGFQNAVNMNQAIANLPFLQAFRQAQLADTVAQTQQRQLAGQMGTVTLPDGRTINVPTSKIPTILGAQIGAQGRVQSAQVGAQAKLDAIKLQTAIQQGQVSHWQDSVNPDTGKPGVEMFNKFGQSLGFADHSIIPGLMAKTSDTVEYKEDANGVMHILPKRTVSSVQIPNNATPSGAPGQQAFPEQQTGGGPGGGGVGGGGAGGRGQGGGGTGGQVQHPHVAGQSTTNPQAGGFGRIVPGFQGKAAADMGYAYDENNKLRYVSRAEANQMKLTEFEPTKPSDVRSDKSALRMLNDVQSNKSQYAEAAQQYVDAGKGGEIGKDDFWLAKLITPGNGFGTVGMGGIHLTLPMSDVLNTVFNAEAYNRLSPQGKKLIEGYIRAMGAVPAYQKALTGIGRSNKEMLDLELANVPNPLILKTEIVRRLQAFQDNIDRAADGFPQFRDVPNVASTRAKYEPSWFNKQPHAVFSHQVFRQEQR